VIVVGDQSVLRLRDLHWRFNLWDLTDHKLTLESSRLIIPFIKYSPRRSYHQQRDLSHRLNYLILNFSFNLIHERLIWIVFVPTKTSIFLRVDLPIQESVKVMPIWRWLHRVKVINLWIFLQLLLLCLWIHPLTFQLIIPALIHLPLFIISFYHSIQWLEINRETNWCNGFVHKNTHFWVQLLFST